MRKWNTRKIAFVAVFIAIATIMLILGIRLVPLAIIPTIRFSIIGLPIKITGFIFGPIIGAVTGLLADLISFQFAPSTYSPWYTLALSVTGLIPGLISWLFFDIIKKRNEQNYTKKITAKQEEISILLIKQKEALMLEDNLSKRRKIQFRIKNLERKLKRTVVQKIDTNLLNTTWITCLVLLAVVISVVIGIVMAAPQSTFAHSKFIKTKVAFLSMVLAGTLLMMLFITVIRFIPFFQQKERFITMISIVVFSAILEPIASIILSQGDVQSGVFPTFETALISHFISSPIKIWVNLFVIYITSLIVIPIVRNKTKNGY
ncbi:ECF transporter S component [Mycoplasma procyoni]|uniref:ECF transporter S component n=1 Tax=Mycoplasma procyoni TaxID=568784 RepID=UPI00197BB951|nr:ECF transporter S component [Mycoplasma procyoni]MBN3535061.1 ECF transporter S component [Mycoplasma procyoni]